MRSMLRFFAYAFAMLVVAVAVAVFLSDDPKAENGSSEITGKIAGLTKFQQSKTELSPVAAEEKTGITAALKTVADTAENKNTEQKVPVKAPELPDADSAGKDSVQNIGTTGQEKQNISTAEASVPQKKEKTVPLHEQKENVNNAAGADSGTNRENVRAEQGQQANISAAQDERVITSARFSMQGSQIKLALQGNAPLVGHYFPLKDPERIVLDLAGHWKIDMPNVPANRLIQAVRVGQHDDKTRIVFDMKTQGKAALVPLNRNALELRIQ